MAVKIRPVEYFYCVVKDRPGEAFHLLTHLAEEAVNLLAFNIIPLGPDTTQLTLFPENVEGLARVAERTGLVISGPQHAIMIQGDDELGALVPIHRKLYDAGINVYASNGVNDGCRCYGYVLYVRPDQFDQAVNVLIG